jgi:hypothetical protein
VTASDQYASVRYLVDDVQTAVDFYTTHPVSYKHLKLPTKRLV